MGAGKRREVDVTGRLETSDDALGLNANNPPEYSFEIGTTLQRDGPPIPMRRHKAS